MAAVLSGMDSVVFTPGVGENSSEVRVAICSAMDFLGIKLYSEVDFGPSLDAGVSTTDSRAVFR
jgi:acetate kinase